MTSADHPCLGVLAHASQGDLSPSAAELLGLARRLRGQEPQAIKALLLGQGLVLYNGPVWVAVLTPLLKELDPAWVLIPHDSQGPDYAPALSLRLDAACLGPVEGLEEANGRPVFLRPGQGGKLLWRMRLLSSCTLVTVLPGAFPVPPPAHEPAPLSRLTSQAQAQGISHLGWRKGQDLDRELMQAQTVVAVGRGLGSRDKLPLAQNLAACLGGALAGSRPVCDLGWLGYDQQVGQTGATVAPRLYVACGISGARQHTLGMQGSGFIVAINHDPQTPMHDLADVSVVADLARFLSALLEACQAIK